MDYLSGRSVYVFTSAMFPLIALGLVFVLNPLAGSSTGVGFRHASCDRHPHWPIFNLGWWVVGYWTCSASSGVSSSASLCLPHRIVVAPILFTGVSRSFVNSTAQENPSSISENPRCCRIKWSDDQTSFSTASRSPHHTTLPHRS